MYPEDTEEDIKSLYKEVVTTQDLSDLIRLTDAVLQYESYQDNEKYKIEVSEVKIIQSLNPMVQESKKYLYTRGFSEREIQDMIIENNAVETDLIPLVMKLTEADLSQPSLITKVNQRYSFSLLNLLSTPVNARNLVTQDYVNCAIAAIGVDLAAGFSFSSAKTWGKAAIKKAFKAIAQRVLGPIGVALAVGSFGYCMYEAATKYDCQYSIPITSQFENKYKTLTEIKKINKLFEEGNISEIERDMRLQIIELKKNPELIKKLDPKPIEDLPLL